MPFSDEDYQKIRNCEKNVLLSKDATERYREYRAKDPFPEIVDALLNSVDIVKYCMATGMIEPFDIEDVKGVTYTCHFSGKYYYWAGSSTAPERKTESDNPELILRPNSITYLEIGEMLRVPEYLIIRYNLQVNHVYKGLLLGTGPIVDPGFEGHLYIPLHNLTSNEYLIKKGAPLITLEFTKVGRNVGENAWPEVKSSGFDFSFLRHQTKVIKPDRDFDCYLHKALLEDELFKNTKDNLSVGSSIPQKIESAESAAKAAEKSAKKSEKSLASTKIILSSIGIVGLIAIYISISGVINDVNGRIDSVLSNSVSVFEENCRLQEENTDLKEKNAALQAMIEKLTFEKKDEEAEEPLD